MADPEVLRIIEEYTKITNKFVKEHPFSSLDELKVIVHGPTGVGFLPQETAQRCLSVLNNRYYPHLKRIYDTAGNDASVTKDAGREISKIGGFAAMQVIFNSHYYTSFCRQVCE